MSRILATSLDSVRGCDYQKSSNQLFFVENSGSLSKLDLIRNLDFQVFKGTATVPADTSLDLVDGTSISGGQIRWDHTDPSHGRVMRGQGNCDVKSLGLVDFDSITYAELQNINYSSDSIHGDPGPGNQLADNFVFAVRNWSPGTHDIFDYAKVKVLSYGANLQLTWVSYKLKPPVQVLGTGYRQPADIKLSESGQIAYVTERVGMIPPIIIRPQINNEIKPALKPVETEIKPVLKTLPGSLLRVDLKNPNRSNATVVASGITSPGQIFLDETRGQAYVTECTSPGQLLRIDLASGGKTSLLHNLENPGGLVITSDLRFAYISEQTASGGKVARYDLVTGSKETLPLTFTNPGFLEWINSGESGILVIESGTASEISLIDLTTQPVSKRIVQNWTGKHIESLSIISPEQIIAASGNEIDQIDAGSSLIGPAGPYLLGVGLIPKDRISRGGDADSEGYADTTPDTGYRLQVKDAPFGGVLSIMINHEKAFSQGALYYQILVDGVPQKQSWGDYYWSSSLNSFEYINAGIINETFYKIRKPYELWFNHWLGYVLDTRSLSNGRHTVGIRFWKTPAAISGNEIGSISDTSQNVILRIDNQVPQTSIDKVYHAGDAVGKCAVVNTAPDEFTFQITASDPQQHMGGWRLTALWGDNQSIEIDSDNYSNHISANKKWAGISGTVPSVKSTQPWHSNVAGDPYSHWCAHTFYLETWDRAIDGYGYLHWGGYHKSITIAIEPAPTPGT
ncbi:MAG TPA: hypothetical protein VF941_09720 [Clostridia bacterium]